MRILIGPGSPDGAGAIESPLRTGLHAPRAVTARALPPRCREPALRAAPLLRQFMQVRGVQLG